MSKVAVPSVLRRQILKGAAAGVGYSLFPARLLAAAEAADGAYEDGFERSSALEAEVDPRVVLGFIDAVFAQDLDLHSLMLYRHGSVVAEGWCWPYASYRPHIMHSLTKSVTACAVGIAIDEGRFSLEDPVVSFFDSELPAVIDERLEAMTVRDLLTMQSGHDVSVSGSVFRPIKTSWVAEFFKIPVVYEPGTHFLYSSAVSFMLSAIVTRTTGEAIRDYLEPRLFQPLNISDLSWGASPNGISSGGNGLTWRSADSLKLGVLHANGGRWGDRQIISESWVKAATSSQVPSGEYGYQWWVQADADAYFAAGAFGQFSIVFPRHDAVLAITAGVQSGEALREVVWQYFPAAFESSARATLADQNALADRLEHLRLLPAARPTTSETASTVSGQTYQIDRNDDDVASVRLDFSDDEMTFRQVDHRGEHRVRVGLSHWIESETGITGNKLHHQYQSDNMKVVAHGYWWDDRTFEMTWQFVETAWVDTVVCRFYDNRISIDRRTNANYAPRVSPTLRGRANREA